ncbi:MAG: DNA-directed RNA polymerase subunit K [Candidatus Hodarchaeales archaeon]
MANIDNNDNETHENLTDENEYEDELTDKEEMEHPEEFEDEYDQEYMEEVTEITEDQIRALVKIGPPILTRFEKARILGTRALQISMSAPPLLDFEEDKDKELTDPLLIAVQELEAKVLPISVRRFLPDGRYQDIPLQYLYLDWTRKARDR